MKTRFCLQVLKSENSKRDPDRGLIRTLMDLTFAYRRWELVEGASVKHILETYPALTHEEEVRVYQPSNLKAVFRQGWKTDLFQAALL